MKILDLTAELSQQIRALYLRSPNFKIRPRMHLGLLKNKGDSQHMLADILEVGQIPKNTDVKAQEKFKDGRFRRLIQCAESHRIRLLFLNASHFVRQPFLDYR